MWSIVGHLNFFSGAVSVRVFRPFFNQVICFLGVEACRVCHLQIYSPPLASYLLTLFLLLDLNFYYLSSSLLLWPFISLYLQALTLLAISFFLKLVPPVAFIFLWDLTSPPPQTILPLMVLPLSRQWTCVQLRHLCYSCSGFNITSGYRTLRLFIFGFDLSPRSKFASPTT